MTAPIARPTGKLLRVLGVGFGLAVTLGNTIGGGILRAPGEVAANSPNEAVFLAIWIVGGLYALLGAVSLAELGAMMPRSGGQYIFARTGIGEYAGFVVGWNDWISTCGSAAAVSIVLAESLGAIVPAVADRTAYVASAVIVAFTLLLWRDVRIGARMQEVTSTLKALAFIALVVACFAVGARYLPPDAVAPPGPSGDAAVRVASLAAIVLALQAVIYTYDGWTGVIYFSEEVRDPGRDIPRSMFGGVISVTVIYLLVNVAFLHVLPLSALAGQPLAAGAVADALFGPRGGDVVNGLVVIALLSSVNAFLPMCSRILFAMSTDGLFARAGARVNAGGTPTVALALSAIVAIAFILTGTFSAVIALLAVFFVANYVLSFIALIRLRRTAPDAPRPYRAWGYPWTTLIALGGSLAFLVATVVGDPGTAMKAGVVLVVSVPAYLALRRAKDARG
jgi:APA family basic amino acid/polyamine antiporter